MSRVDCSHNIAFAILEPVGGNDVHVTLGGDVRGEAVLPYDPVVLQDWIYKGTGLTCFPFERAFEQLAEEIEPFQHEEMLAREIEAVRSKFTRKLKQAEEVRKTWKSSCHNANQVSARSWSPSKWTDSGGGEEIDEQRKLRVYGG